MPSRSRYDRDRRWKTTHSSAHSDQARRLVQFTRSTSCWCTGRPAFSGTPPLTHQLQALRVLAREDLEAFLRDCHTILPEASGTGIVLVGDINRVAALYKRPESLLWRDAGVLLQTLALVATAYRLAFCPLGILGTAVVRALGLPEPTLGVGVALIGRVRDNGTHGDLT